MLALSSATWRSMVHVTYQIWRRQKQRRKKFRHQLRNCSTSKPQGLRHLFNASHAVPCLVAARRKISVRRKTILTMKYAWRFGLCLWTAGLSQQSKMLLTWLAGTSRNICGRDPRYRLTRRTCTPLGPTSTPESVCQSGIALFGAAGGSAHRTMSWQSIFWSTRNASHNAEKLLNAQRYITM